MPYVSKAKREALFRDGLKICCHCHEIKPLAEYSAQRNTRDGLRFQCRGCTREDHRAQYYKNREEILARHREHNKTDHRREWNRHYQRERQRRERETLADRPRPSACEVCGCEGPVFYDHDHRTGKRIGRFRGWLCNGCNTALGYVKNDASILRRLADYLDRYAVKLEEIA